MRKFKLVCSVFSLFVFSATAWAEVPPAERAAVMLAKAQSIDIKCNFLSVADKEVMAKLVARAELALANRESIEATKAAMQRGHDEGAASDCKKTPKASVMDILAAAKNASAPDNEKPAETAEQKPATPAKPTSNSAAVASDSAPKETPKPAVPAVAALPDEPAKPAASQPAVKEAKAEPAFAKQPETAKNVKAAAAKAPVEKQAVAKPEPVVVAKAKAIKPQAPVVEAPKPEVVAQVPRINKPVANVVTKAGDLEHYARSTEAYYMALRCGAPDVGGMYQAIVSEHDAVMQSHSQREVALALSRAKASASGRSCG